MIRLIVEGVEIKEDEDTDIAMSPELEYLLEVYMENNGGLWVGGGFGCPLYPLGG